MRVREPHAGHRVSLPVRDRYGRTPHHEDTIMASTSYSKDHYANATDKVTSTLADTAATLAEKASEKAANAKVVAEDVAAEVMKRGQEAGKQLEAVGGNIKTAVDKSVTEQPMATLAVAAALGFVIGALWKS
jgi:ElaB/YqjD/DUF883 family membrane-anchored ribosome-binding protein